MNEIREIVTRAVVGKGKKIIRIKDEITPHNKPFSILGCWVINHEFTANLLGDKVEVTGSFEVDVWYSYDNNTGTDVARKVVDYCDTVKTRQIVKDTNDSTKDVIVRVLQQPTCTNANIQDDNIVEDIIFELVAEIIGGAKMIVSILTPVNTCDVIDDDFENEINENFINVN